MTLKSIRTPDDALDTQQRPGGQMLDALKTDTVTDDEAQLPYTLPEERMKPETLLRQLDAEIEDARRKLQALTEARMALAAIYEVPKPPPQPTSYTLPEPPIVPPPPRQVSPKHASQVRRQCVCGDVIQGPSFYRHVKECVPYRKAGKVAKARATLPLKGVE